MYRHGITVICLLVATVCYAIGFGLGIELAAIVGAVSELAFWYRLSGTLTRQRAYSSKQSAEHNH